MTKLPAAPPPPENEAPDVPGFHTWKGVYLFVLGSFVACVLLLTLFTHWFSR